MKKSARLAHYHFIFFYLEISLICILQDVSTRGISAQNREAEIPLIISSRFEGWAGTDVGISCLFFTRIPNFVLSALWEERISFFACMVAFFPLGRIQLKETQTQMYVF